MKEQYFDDVENRPIGANGAKEACLVDYEGNRAILLRNEPGKAPIISTQQLPNGKFEIKVRIDADLYTCRNTFVNKKAAEQFAIKIESDFLKV